MDLRSILSGIFTQAHRWGLWNERNPAADATVGRKRAARERHNISEDAIRELFRELPEDVRVIIQMALFFTLTISEILGLQEKHLEFYAGVGVDGDTRHVTGWGRLHNAHGEAKLSRTETGGSSQEALPTRLGGVNSASKPVDGDQAGSEPARQHQVSGTIHVRQRYYRGNVDVPKNAKRARDIPMGAMAEALRQRCTGDPERFVFGVMTKFGESRDDRDINQHFLRPAAKRLGIYFQGFGFHQFRRQAITALGIDPMQAQKIAGHSKADMSLHYTLDDRDRQDAAIRKHQNRILGVIPIRKKASA